MKLTPIQRRSVLGAALALAIVGRVVLGGNDPMPVTEPVVTKAALESASAVKHGEPENKPANLLALDKLNRTPLAAEGIDLFASKSWYVPPPPPQPVKPVAPPKPTAPPMPYSYLGQIEDNDGLKVFLVRGDELLTAKQGDVLDKDYRLEAITAEQVILVYLPLDLKQILPAGGK